MHIPFLLIRTIKSTVSTINKYQSKIKIVIIGVTYYMEKVKFPLKSKLAKCKTFEISNQICKYKFIKRMYLIKQKQT
jgi:hypothetical protein